MQEKESVVGVQFRMKNPFPQDNHSASQNLPSYPQNRFFQLQFTLMKDSYIHAENNYRITGYSMVNHRTITEWLDIVICL